MDSIDDIVDRAMRYTERILDLAPHHHEAARHGLTTMRENLTSDAGNHRALVRLDKYLGKLKRKFAEA